MPDTEVALPSLTPGAQRLVETAAEKQRNGQHAQLGAHHWLLALVERHAAMAEAMTQGVEAASLRRYLGEHLRAGDLGAALDQESLVSQSTERARARGAAQVSERDLAAVILAAAGYPVIETPVVTPSSTGSEAQRPPSVPVGGSSRPSGASRPTPALDQFGRDLTREARAGTLPPVVGRTDEIDLVMETLCRRTKRNPVLVGPAGVGKTAIVEGLARRIAQGEVPEPLRGARLVALQPSTLVAGASMLGETEKRMKAVLAEASQDGILLFIDEVHSIIGAGGREGSGDIASLLKPALARGDLACIAATTDDEYRRFIEPDAALERRFQPVRVQELTPEQTLTVLGALRDDLTRLRGVEVPDEVLRWLVEFAGDYLRNRYFPDKGVDLLEQCVAHAVAQGQKTVGLDDAGAVARRMIGMPLEVGERLTALGEQLARRALLAPEQREQLLNRLEVTMRGLDLQPARPSAVLLLLGEAAAGSGALAEVAAETLFGAAERVVEIDLSRFIDNEDVTMLVGSPRGYVGYGESLPLHRVAQMPWCVLQLDNVHACHPAVLEVVRQALAAGFFTDSAGKRIYLSDTLILLTANIAMASTRPMGFHASSAAPAADARQAAMEALGADLVDQCDLICTEVPTSEAARRSWLETHLLFDVAERYRRKGIELHWDETIIRWLLDHQQSHARQRDWERLVDEWLTPPLVRCLGVPQNSNPRSMRVSFSENGIHVVPSEQTERSE